jgi:acyl-CoA thioester hydrolase
VQDFRHHIDLKVRFGDVDMLGHVNNAQYITYVEEARIQYARDVFGWDGTPSKLGLIVARITIDYLMPLYSGEIIRMYTRCTRLGNKSFDLAHLMIRTEDDALASKVETTLVAYDAVAETSHPIPDTFRNGIVGFENVPPEGSHAS